MLQLAVSGQVHRAGMDSRASLMRSFLSWNGLELSEAFAFGLGCGYGFTFYDPHAKSVSPTDRPSVSYASAYQDAFVTDFCRNLGIGIRIFKTYRADKAWNAIPKLLKQGRPALLTVRNSSFRQQLGLSTDAHDKNPNDWRDFKIWVIDYEANSETVSVLDGEHDGVRIFPAADLKEIWARGNALGPEHYWNDLVVPLKMYDLAYAAKYALAKSVRRMQEPFEDGQGIGLPGLRRFVEYLMTEQGSHSEWEWTVSLSGLDQGDPFFRKTFANFLMEASDLLHEKGLLQASERADECAGRWEMVIGELVKGKLPDSMILQELVTAEGELANVLHQYVIKWGV